MSSRLSRLLVVDTKTTSASISLAGVGRSHLEQRWLILAKSAPVHDDVTLLVPDGKPIPVGKAHAPGPLF